MKVIIMGNPVDGFVFFGPIEDDADVEQDDVRHLTDDEDWWVAEVQPFYCDMTVPLLGRDDATFLADLAEDYERPDLADWLRPKTDEPVEPEVREYPRLVCPNPEAHPPHYRGQGEQCEGRKESVPGFLSTQQKADLWDAAHPKD